jgi:hypothetical protein
MNEIIVYAKRQIEKIIFFFVLLIFCCYSLFFCLNVLKSSGVTNVISRVCKKIDYVSKKQVPSIEKIEKTDYVSNLKGEKTFSNYKEILTRNIFLPYSVAIKDSIKNNPYVLVEIIKKECPFVWKGIMISKDLKEVFAQLNTSKSTHFVKAGDIIEEYKIIDVNEMFVEIQKNDIKLRLELNKIMYEGEDAAKIYNRKTKETNIVVLNDEIDSWIVQIVGKTYVRLGKDKELLYVKKEKIDEL